MKRSQFMIMDYPHLVKYFASKNPIALILKLVPLWVLFTYFILSQNVSLGSIIFSFLLGIFYWTFLEYFIHRYVYHPFYKSKLVYYFLGSFHLYHHKEMSDHRVLTAGFLMIYFITPIVLFPLWVGGLSLGTLCAIGLGLSISYYFYEWVHYILHYKVHESGYLNYIQKYHLYHHDHAPQKNFGNTSHLWDYLLGTYDPKYRDYVLPESTEKTLITEVQRSGVYAQL